MSRGQAPLPMVLRRLVGERWNSLNNFEYLEPKSLSEACSLLVRGGDKFVPISGGTELVPRMKRGLMRPEGLVDLKAIPGLDSIQYRKGSGASIGALATLREVSTSPDIGAVFPMLAEAASKVASPLTRNLATIGGNLCQDVRCYYYDQSEFWRKSIEPCLKLGGKVCHQIKNSKVCKAIFYSDMAPALTALGAKAKIVGLNGERWIKLEDLHIEAGQTCLKRGEILSELAIEDLPAYSGCSFARFSLRESIDYPQAIASVALTVDREGGRCIDARVALGAIAPKPIKAEEIERLIEGEAVSEGLVEEAARMAKKHVAPIQELFCEPDYRRELLTSAVKRAFKTAYLNACSQKYG